MLLASACAAFCKLCSHEDIRGEAAHVHLKPTWQQPPGTWVSVHCPGMEQPTELGPLQGLEAGMVYRQSGSTYSTGLAV